MRKGIDVSKWDTEINWSKYDWDFAFIKVSEGTVIDPLFDYHWVNAKGHTDRSGYHFFRAFVDPRQSAQRFIEFLKGDMGELPPVLDLESTNNIDARTVCSRALTWLLEYKRVTGVKPIVYSSPSFIGEVDLWDNFAEYDLWLATYPFDTIYTGYTEADRTQRLKGILDNPESLSIPPAPAPFKKIKYIQWTAKLNPKDVPGYYTGTGSKKAVDCNFELDTEEPMPEIIKEGTIQGALLAPSTKLNIRDAASSTARDLGDLFDGDRIYGVVSGGWMRLTKIIRANGTIENITGYASATYMTLRDIPVEPPIPTPTRTITGATVRFNDGTTQELVVKP